MADHSPLFELPYTIGIDDIEPVYRHVHHARSLVLWERAREAMMRARGVPNEGFIARNLFIVIASVSVRYRRELLEGPAVVTCERMTLAGRRLFSLTQRILDSERRCAVEGEVQMVFMSGETKRAVAPPAEFINAFKG